MNCKVLPNSLADLNFSYALHKKILLVFCKHSNAIDLADDREVCHNGRHCINQPFFVRSEHKEHEHGGSSSVKLYLVTSLKISLINFLLWRDLGQSSPISDVNTALKAFEGLM